MNTTSDTEICDVQWENHFEKLSSVLRHLAHCGDLTDITILFEEESISVHHVILSCFTTYFDHIIKNGNVQFFVQTQQDKRVLRALVDYIYTGQVSVPYYYRHSMETAAASMKIEGSSMFDNTENGEHETTFRWQQHQQLLSIKVWESRQNSSLCDVMFILNNEHRTYAHSCILAACSPFLLQMFTRRCSERRRPYVIAMHNIKKIDLEFVIEYCYKGYIQIPAENLSSVHSVADLLGVNNLTEKLVALHPGVLLKPPKLRTTNSVSIIRTSAIPTTLSDLFKYERLVDIFLCNGEKLFKAHSVILSVYSVFFQKLAKYLNYNLKGVIVLIKNVEINVEAFLDYLYAGEAKFEGDADEFYESMDGWLDFSVLPVSSRRPGNENEREGLRVHNSRSTEIQVPTSSGSDISDARKISSHGLEEFKISHHACRNSSVEVVNERETYEEIKGTAQEIGIREALPEVEMGGKAENCNHLSNSECFESKSDDSDADDPDSISIDESNPEQIQLNTMQIKRQHSKELSCHSCKKDFDSQLSLEEHLQIHPQCGVLQCNFCSSRFSKPCLLQQHLSTHTDQESLKCAIRDMNFTGKHSTKKHVRAHELDKPKTYVCEVCKKVFTRKEYLEEHKRTHTGIKPFKCEECGKCFIGKTGLNHHRKVHMNDAEKKTVICEVCGKNFTRHALWTHIKHHKKEHLCEYCNKMFATTAALNVHAHRVHLGQFRHRCEKCGKGFMKRNHLDRHVKTHDEGESARSFACSECPSKFKEKSKLKTHFKHKHTPLGEQTFPCSLCPKRFRSHSSAVFHKKLHFSDHPHRCNLCGKTFGRPYQLRDHTRTQHSDEKPFECPVCKKRCSTPSLLKKHLLIHKPCPTPKPQEPGAFSCKSCSKAFSSKLALSNHSRIHNYSRPFECSVCRKAFHHQENLMKHLRQKHSSSVPPSDGVTKELPCIYTIQVCRPSFSQMTRETITTEEYANNKIQNDELNDGQVISQNIPIGSSVCLNATERSNCDVNLLQLKPVEGSFMTQANAEEMMMIPDFALHSSANKTSESINPVPRRPYSITIDGNLCCNNILSTDGGITLVQEHADLGIDMSTCTSVSSHQLLHITAGGNHLQLYPIQNENNSDLGIPLSKEFAL